jgi:hypothetical protein
LQQLRSKKRILQLSMEELKKEAAIAQGEELSVLHFAAAHRFLFVALARLIEAVGIDACDKDGDTAIMCCEPGDYRSDAVFEEFANMKADLSIISNEGNNLYEKANRDGVPEYRKTDALKLLAKHGVTSETIVKGFRSTLNESAIMPQPTKLAEEYDFECPHDPVRFYLGICRQRRRSCRWKQRSVMNMVKNKYNCKLYS